MSKHMQLTVRVRPYYEKGLKTDYPKIAKGLNSIRETWVDKGISLFEIVGKLDKLLYELEGNPSFREILLKYRDRLRRLHKEIETHIANWELKEADQALYQIEDIFDQIEWELN